MVKDNGFSRENLASIDGKKAASAYQMVHESKVLAHCFPTVHNSAKLDLCLKTFFTHPLGFKKTQD